MKENKAGLRISAIDQDILTALGRRELYGLELLSEVNIGRSIELSFGSLYPALNRLEQKGLISWSWGDEDEVSGGGRRKYYKMTALGVSALQEVEEYRLNLMRRASMGIG